MYRVMPAPTSHATCDRWQTIFDGDRARVVVVGPAGEVLSVNRAWLARHGELHAGTPWTEQNCFDVLVGDGSAGSVTIAQAISDILDGNRDEFEAGLQLAAGPPRKTAVRAYSWVHRDERWAVVRFEDAAAL